MTLDNPTPTTDTSRTGDPTANLPKVSAGFLVLYALANFGLYLTVMMPALFSLPYKVGVLAPDDKVPVLGLVATVGAVVGLIAGPVAGALSDRTHTRIGRRRPWFLGGIAVLALASVLVAVAPNVPTLMFAWGLVSIGSAGIGAAITPVVAERVPESQRGLVSALIGVATQLAGVMGYSIGGLLTWNLILLFLLPVITLAVLGGAFLFLLREPMIELPRQSLGRTFRDLVFDPRKHRDFSLLWLGKLFMQTAFAFLSTYQLYFLLDRLGFTAEEAGARLALAGGIGIVVTMTFAVVSGTISDRIKRRKGFILAATVLAAGGLGLMSITDGFGLFFAAVMFILGAAGMFGAVDVAMASDLVPQRDQAGRWMATYNVAATLSTAIAPLAGAGLLLIGSAGDPNYTALYAAGAVLALATGTVTMFIRGVR